MTEGIGRMPAATQRFHGGNGGCTVKSCLTPDDYGRKVILTVSNKLAGSKVSGRLIRLALPRPPCLLPFGRLKTRCGLQQVCAADGLQRGIIALRPPNLIAILIGVSVTHLTAGLGRSQAPTGDLCGHDWITLNADEPASPRRIEDVPAKATDNRLAIASAPNTLVIGDSIAHGWSKYLPVKIPKQNCRGSRHVLEQLDKWFGQNHWRTIVFNAGLHDILQHVPPDEYMGNLQKIVRRLRPKTDRLYFCSITPGRETWFNCTPQAVDLYQCGAMRVMYQERVKVIDLYGFAMRHKEFWNRDIHYSGAGYRAFAKVVEESIREPAHTQ